MHDTLGKRLRMLRGVSREVFAKKYGIHSQTLGRYEKDIRIPDNNFIQMVADGEGISYEWLKNGIGEIIGAKRGLQAEVSDMSETSALSTQSQHIEISNNLSKPSEVNVIKTSDMSDILKDKNEIISLLKEKTELIQQNSELRFQLKEKDDQILRLEDEIASLKEELKEQAAIQSGNKREAG